MPIARIERFPGRDDAGKAAIVIAPKGHGSVAAMCSASETADP